MTLPKVIWVTAGSLPPAQYFPEDRKCGPGSFRMLYNKNFIMILMPEYFGSDFGVSDLGLKFVLMIYYLVLIKTNFYSLIPRIIQSFGVLYLRRPMPSNYISWNKRTFEY